MVSQFKQSIMLLVLVQIQLQVLDLELMNQQLQLGLLLSILGQLLHRLTQQDQPLRLLLLDMLTLLLLLGLDPELELPLLF